MRGLLVTRDGCPPCVNAKEALKDYIASGEIEVADADDELEKFNDAAGIEQFPMLVFVADNGEVIAKVPLE